MTDQGLTHVALAVTDVARSVRFYADYAGFQVVHERHDDDTGSAVVWISDLTRPFVLVLIQVAEVAHLLSGYNHLGVGVASRDEVDRLATRAHGEGRLRLGPVDAGYPVGYWAIIGDPDGHHLEVSHGQEVGVTVRGRVVKPDHSPDATAHPSDRPIERS
jgi:catechol 2,3-dioxygenase-like lactoylglutathione lyase family enzyme